MTMAFPAVQALPPRVLAAVLVAASLFSLLAAVPLFTLSLGLIAALRSRRGDHRRNGKLNDDGEGWSQYRTALYAGRVSHTRFVPVVHAFSYPLFFCLLDLSEVDELFGGEGIGGRGKLWPLSLVMSFGDEDHLKNGEGTLQPPKIDPGRPSDGGGSKQQTKDRSPDNSLQSRVGRLVAERTKGECSPRPETHRIVLLTHLRYFGYCFNPVSFYYVLRRDDGTSGSERTEAIVAEVSNTPWNEMKCYVLHPDSVDVTEVKGGATRDRPSVSDGGRDATAWRSTNYVFPKTFHVSPFMDIDHTYDWTFWDVAATDSIVVSTTMLKGSTKYFSAFFDIARRKFHPLAMCYQLIRLPFYCVIIQLWIHYEAFRLFVKGVVFVPHPEGSETAASRIIAQIMVPFFAVKGWVDRCNGSYVEDKKEKVS